MLRVRWHTSETNRFRRGVIQGYVFDPEKGVMAVVLRSDHRLVAMPLDKLEHDGWGD